MTIFSYWIFDLGEGPVTTTLQGPILVWLRFTSNVLWLNFSDLNCKESWFIFHCLLGCIFHNGGDNCTQIWVFMYHLNNLVDKKFTAGVWGGLAGHMSSKCLSFHAICSLWVSVNRILFFSYKWDPGLKFTYLYLCIQVFRPSSIFLQNSK